jgi:hypothetical protein
MYTRCQILIYRVFFQVWKYINNTFNVLFISRVDSRLMFFLPFINNFFYLTYKTWKCANLLSIYFLKIPTLSMCRWAEKS